jgi:phosphatidate phosphatase APP1
VELVGVPEKMDEYFHLGPIFYVCNSARNWVPFMYKGINNLFPLGSGNPGCLKLLNWNISKKTCPLK